MILEGNITIPYKWTTGPAVGRFLGELKDNARIMGGRCDGCGKVYVPPPDVCGECFKPLADWVEISGEGTIIAISNVERALPWSPVLAPYRIALIKLDGADTNMIHLANKDVSAGDRVRAVFKQVRKGSILDIECFAPVSDEAQADSLRESDMKGEFEMSADREQTNESLSEVGKIFQLLPTRFRQGIANKQISYYFSIDDEGWTVFVGPDDCEVKEGKAVEEADCFLKTSAEIFLSTVRGEYTPSFMDLMTGKIKTNNPALLQTFRDIFGE